MDSSPVHQFPTFISPSATDPLVVIHPLVFFEILAATSLLFVPASLSNPSSFFRPMRNSAACVALYRLASCKVSAWDRVNSSSRDAPISRLSRTRWLSVSLWFRKLVKRQRQQPDSIPIRSFDSLQRSVFTVPFFVLARITYSQLFKKFNVTSILRLLSWAANAGSAGKTVSFQSGKSDGDARARGAAFRRRFMELVCKLPGGGYGRVQAGALRSKIRANFAGLATLPEKRSFVR